LTSVLQQCSHTVARQFLLTCRDFFCYFLLFAEHRAFEHTEQSLTECLGHSADSTKALITAYPNSDASYLGCYASTNNSDPTGARLIGANSTRELYPMSHTACYNYCQTVAVGAPYQYFGVEFGVNCRCGNQLNPGFPANKTLDSSCSTVSNGTDNEAGGGRQLITLYRVASPSTVRQLSFCSMLKCSALCKLLLLSLQGQYAVSTTALWPSHSNTSEGVSWGHGEHYDLDRYNTNHHHTNRHGQWRQILDTLGDDTVSTPPPLPLNDRLLTHTSLMALARLS
jgi:hypothetical protein